MQLYQDGGCRGNAARTALAGRRGIPSSGRPAPTTRTEPRQFPIRIEYVVVNDTVVVDRGRHTGALPGRALKHGRPSAQVSYGCHSEEQSDEESGAGFFLAAQP